MKMLRIYNALLGQGHIPRLEKHRTPGLFDYADGVDTMQFMLSL